MKARREHRIPLSAAALRVLHEMAKLRISAAPEAIVFPGQRQGKGLSNMAMLVLLRRMGRGDLTAHGFRSRFRDCAVETGKPSDIAEAALAHTLGDKTTAVYQHGDQLELRRKLMEGWGFPCADPD